MLIQFLFFNIAGFSLSVFIAFVFFAAGLLYFDSWNVDKLKKAPLIRSIGFFLLAIAATAHSVTLSLPLVATLTELFKIAGLATIFLSLIKEPIPHAPKKEKLALVIPLVLPVLNSALVPLSAVLMLLIAIWYLRQSTEGKEKQRRFAALAFFFLALAEFVSAAYFWADTTNVFWSKLLAQFGVVWSIEHIFELIGITILAIWIWGYIRFRLNIQLFVTTVALTLSIFLITTFFFTFLLLRNLENDALSHLKIDIRVVQYAIEQLQKEALASTTAVAENSDVKTAVINKNTNDLYNLTSKLMLSYNASDLAVTDTSGRVIMRGEDKENVGDTLVFDPTVVSALKGHSLATVITLGGAIAPQIQIKAAVPFYNGQSLLGVISSGFWIDSAFVDGVKEVTGLDVAVFGGNKRAATTFVAADNKTRLIGTLETNKDVLSQVLQEGQIYTGASNVLNQPYYIAYAPLKTFGNKPIGMLFVGEPQTTLFAAAQKSIDLTFLSSIILMILSIIPAFLLARYIKENLEA